MKEKKEVFVSCSLRISDSRRFIVSDGTEASQALAKELNKMNIKDVEGELCFDFFSKTKKERKEKVSTRCFFRSEYRTRDFTTPGNFEASNMLINKLMRRGVVETEGELFFEFIPPREIQWRCDDCGEKGAFREGTIKNYLYLCLKIQGAHHKASPNCSGKKVVGLVEKKE